MIRLLFSAAAAAATLLAVPASAITYFIGVGDNSLGVSGFIRTNGHIGTLGHSSITNWRLNATTIAGNFQLNGPKNSDLNLQGSDLSATAKGLFFNFSGSGFAAFSNPDGFICFTATNACDGIASGIRFERLGFRDGIAQAGTVQIGTSGLGAIPEPSSWAMLIAGFGLVGAVARRRKASIAA